MGVVSQRDRLVDLARETLKAHPKPEQWQQAIKAFEDSLAIADDAELERELVGRDARRSAVKTLLQHTKYQNAPSAKSAGGGHSATVPKAMSAPSSKPKPPRDLSAPLAEQAETMGRRISEALVMSPTGLAWRR